MRGKDFCRGCNSTSLFSALDLGFSPIANNVIPPELLEAPEPWYPLVLRVCDNCYLGQLGEFAGDSEIFRDYSYLSSTSTTWLDANSDFSNELVELLNLTDKDLVLEIASNDGYLLKFFLDKGVRVLGVEPALNVATISALKGIPTSPEFFSESFAEKLEKKGVSPRLVVAKNVVAHVPDIRDFIGGVAKITRENTLVVVEAPSILNILEGMQFDTVYHEHFSYLSASFFDSILSEFGLKLIGAEAVSTHGGSMRLFISRKNSNVEVPDRLAIGLLEMLSKEKSAEISSIENWGALASRVGALLQEFRKWVEAPGGRLVGYGAAAKAVTLLSAAQVPRGAIAFCIDNAESKIGRFIPGSSTKIVSENDYFENLSQAGDRFIIFPWNLEAEISNRVRNKNPESRMFVALPHLREV